MRQPLHRRSKCPRCGMSVAPTPIFKAYSPNNPCTSSCAKVQVLHWYSRIGATHSSSPWMYNPLSTSMRQDKLAQTTSKKSSEGDFENRHLVISSTKIPLFYIISTKKTKYFCSFQFFTLPLHPQTSKMMAG